MPDPAGTGRPVRLDQLARPGAHAAGSPAAASIFLLVVGSIYLGWATPTNRRRSESRRNAFAARYRPLSMKMMREAILGTMRTTGMIMLILVAAWFLNFVLSAIGVNRTLNAFVTQQNLSPFFTLMVVIGFYLILGTVMEPMPMMVITVPTLTPIMASLGYDPVWFGIFVVLLSETALISPPVGANLFVVQGIRGNRGSMNDVFDGRHPILRYADHHDRADHRPSAGRHVVADRLAGMKMLTRERSNGNNIILI